MPTTLSKAIKILVVDDEAVGRHLLEAILIPEGYDVIFGENGHQAIEVATSLLPDVILCDVMMPKMDGYEVCRALRENSETVHIPIFLITALDDRDSRIKGIDAGADDYISKPFDRLEVLAKIKNYTTRIRYRKIVKSETPVVAEKSEFQAIILHQLVAAQQVQDSRIQVEWVQDAPDSDSKHHHFMFRSGERDYVLVISNSLTGIDAVLANILYAQLIRNGLKIHPDSPQGLLENANKQLSGIFNGTSTGASTPDFATALFVLDRETGHMSVSGMQQVVFLCTGTDNSVDVHSLETDSSYEFIPDSTCFLFPSDLNAGNHEEIGILLEQMLEKDTNFNLQQLETERFNQTKDYFLIKLTF